MVHGCSQCEDFTECYETGGCVVKFFEALMVGTEPESDDDYAEVDAEYDPPSIYRVLPAEDDVLFFLSLEDEGLEID